MLEDIDGKKARKRGRHTDDFERRRARISPSEVAAIREALNAVLDATPVGRAISASWVPGKDWTGTVYMPIYMKACEGDFSASALFLGNMMKSVVMDHHSLWRSIRQPKSKDDPEGVQTTLYWRAT